jgi:hypothetical protein
MVEEDHLAAIRHLENVPITFNQIEIAAVIGYAGSGKTYFISRIVVALMLQNPSTRILLTASGNQPVDVLIREVDRALDEARSIDPNFAAILNNKTCSRIHADSSEIAYIIALADVIRQENDAWLAANPTPEDGDDQTPVITLASSGESTDNLDATPVQDNDQTPVITPASSGESADNLDATPVQDNDQTPVITPASSGENTDNLDATSAQDNNC